MSRIESILARAIRKSAVRVVDLFQEWDTDRSGSISKKEFKVLRTAWRLQRRPRRSLPVGTHAIAFGRLLLALAAARPLLAPRCG